MKFGPDSHLQAMGVVQHRQHFYLPADLMYQIVLGLDRKNTARMQITKREKMVLELYLMHNGRNAKRYPYLH